jgi:hypothetical protein
MGGLEDNPRECFDSSLLFLFRELREVAFGDCNELVDSSLQTRALRRFLRWHAGNLSVVDSSMIQRLQAADKHFDMTGVIMVLF